MIFLTKHFKTFNEGDLNSLYQMRKKKKKIEINKNNNFLIVPSSIISSTNESLINTNYQTLFYNMLSLKKHYLLKQQISHIYKTEENEREIKPNFEEQKKKKK